MSNHGRANNRGKMAAGASAVQSVVLNYLSKKGYKNTEATFRQEVGVQSVEELAFRVTAESDASVANYIAFNSVDGSPQRYDESYAKLHAWVDGCLELYREELQAVLFPIFVHCYLDLVAKNFSDEARMFMQTHQHDHIEKHTTDVQKIMQATAAHHLSSNRLAVLFRSNRYKVQLTTYAFNLLVSFLHTERLMLLLAILNQFIEVVVVDRDVERKALWYGAGALAAETDSQVATFNRQEVKWGAVTDFGPREEEGGSDDEEDGAEGDRPAKRAKGNDDDEAGPSDAATTTSTTAEGDVEMTEADVQVATAAKEAAPEPTRVPLPSISTCEKQKLRELEDVRARIAVSATGLPSAAMYTLFNTYDALNCVSLSKDGSTMVAGLSDSTCLLWDVQAARSGKQRKRRGGTETGAELIGHSGAVFATSFSPDGRFVVSGSQDKTARLWSLDTGTNVVAYRGHNFPVWDVSFSPVGTYFATASHDRTARLWTTDRVYPLRIFAGHLSDVDAVAFHPNCNYVATGSDDKSVRLWDIQTGNCVRILLGHLNAVHALAFSPDGRYLASAGVDRAVNIWDLGEGSLVASMNGHTGPVWSLAFARGSSRLLASGSADCSIRFWDVCGAVDQAKADAEAAQIGGRGSASSAGPAASSTRHSPHLVKTLYTKDTPVLSLSFTPRNLLLAAGPFRPPE